MKALHNVAFVLVIIGALNWLLVGLLNWDLVAVIFGDLSIIARIIYVLVGISAIVLLFTYKRSPAPIATM